METLEELQAQLTALTQRVNEITAPPDDYYTHRFSGEEIDNAVGRVAATAGSGAITAGDVGAAPSGFGLGTNEPESISKIEEVDNFLVSGWRRVYLTDGNTIGDSNLGTLFSSAGDRCVQHTFFFYYSRYGAVELRRQRYYTGGVGWTPWEWVNPPMILGVEYRTTERYNGKPVYAKAVNFGAMPNNSQASVAHGIQNIQSCIYVGGTIGTYNLLGFIGVISVFCGVANIAIKTSEDLSSYSAIVILKYTKTTD